MKYVEVKMVVEEQLEKYLSQGYDQSQAETHILEVATAMFREEKIGFMDLKYFFQILGYEFPDGLRQTMEDIKKAICLDYGLLDIIRSEMKSGKTRQEAVEVVIRSAYESFQNGGIEEPELLDMVLWALGYRLSDGFFEMSPEQMKKKLLYEKD